MNFEIKNSTNLCDYNEELSTKNPDQFRQYITANIGQSGIYCWFVPVTGGITTAPLYSGFHTSIDDIGALTITPDITLTSFVGRYELLARTTSDQNESQILDDETKAKQLQAVSELVDDLFVSAQEIEFEDGMMNDLSRGLYSLILDYGHLAMQQVAYLISKDITNPDVSSEALRWLGRLYDPSTYNWRLWLLKKCLTSQSPLLRDGAALGLTSICDKSAILDLQKAINIETITELRDDLQHALDVLNAAPIKKDP